MTSAAFNVCYASVATALFEHIEQDLIHLTTALIDDDDDTARLPEPGTAALLAQDGIAPP